MGCNFFFELHKRYGYYTQCNKTKPNNCFISLKPDYSKALFIGDKYLTTYCLNLYSFNLETAVEHGFRALIYSQNCEAGHIHPTGAKY